MAGGATGVEEDVSIRSVVVHNGGGDGDDVGRHR